MNHRALTILAAGFCLLFLTPVSFTRADNPVANDAHMGAAETPQEDPSIVPSLAIPSRSCMSYYSDPRFILHFLRTDSYEPALATGDFNGDGLDDVVVTRSLYMTGRTFNIDILLNDTGNGELILGTSSVFSGEIPQVQSPASMILVADFNGDTRSDIFVPDGGMDAAPFPGYQNTLVLSIPGGKVIDATSNLPLQNDFTHSAAAADIDDDDDLDLYVGNIWGDNAIPPQIWLNNGSGVFTVATGLLPAAQTDLGQNGYTACEFVDVNNDTFSDLILGDAGDDLAGGPDSVVLLNDSTGHFTLLAGAVPPKPFAVSDVALDIQPADLNYDDYQDLFIAYTKTNYTGRYIQVLLNNQDGTFRDETDTRLPQSNNSNPYVYQLHQLDIDCDQDVDLIARVWDGTNPNPLLYLNQGTGHFVQEPLNFKLPSIYYTFLDFNGDDDLDIAFSTSAPPEKVYGIYDMSYPVFLPSVLCDHSLEE